MSRQASLRGIRLRPRKSSNGRHRRPRRLLFESLENRRLLSAGVTGLSFRSGNQLDSPVLDGVHSGSNVYLRADVTEMEGQTIDVQVCEDDGIGDDLITTVPITIGAQRFGTAPWQAAWQAADEDAPFNRYYLFHDVRVTPRETAN